MILDHKLKTLLNKKTTFEWISTNSKP